MSEFNFDVAGGESIRLATAGKYCDRDIVVTGTGGGGDTSAEDGIIDRTISGDYVNDRVTTIGGYAFNECENLTSVSFPNVKSVGRYSFNGCRNLTSVYFPVATTVGESSNGYVFQRCTSLTSIDLPVATTLGSYQFFGCTNLASVNIPNATSIGAYAFRDCTQLTSLDFPVVTTIRNNAFYRCKALVQLVLRSATVVTLENTNAFTGNPIKDGTGYVYVPDNLVEDYKVATNWATYANQIKPISELGE